MTIYVRARSGCWYRNPMHVFAEGYVSFDPLELVLWLDDSGGFANPHDILEREFHAGAALTGLVDIGDGALTAGADVSERVVPGGSPPIKAPAVGFALTLMRRIPEPSMHDGDERRLSRVSKPYKSIDPPASEYDAFQIYPGPQRNI